MNVLANRAEKTDPPADKTDQRVAIDQPAPDALTFRLSGDWNLKQGLPSAESIRTVLEQTGNGTRINFDASTLGTWDSTLVGYVLNLTSQASERGISIDSSGLPPGIMRLIELATDVPERKDAARTDSYQNPVDRLGLWAMRGMTSARQTITFVGEVTLALGNLARGRSRLRWPDFLLLAQQCGAEALPIVTVVSLLLGLILAFVGAVELKQFGADIYVANLVAVAMLREMAAVMTAIVLAGRTGAAFAAHIGTMQVNEEVDALVALGIPPVDFLVMPRVLALVIMTPLLCVYANLMGIIGGYIVAVSMLNVTGLAYLHQAAQAVTMDDFWIGVGKGAVFGMIVAIAGCLKGINCGRSAADVGKAATAAVVASILYIIVADGVFGVLFNMLGI